MTRILVVAPHPDDDILGCGAVLANAFARGDAVRVVYVTDGSASHPRSRRYPAERLAALREREAAAAIARLGGTRSAMSFLRVRDGTVGDLAGAGRASVVDALRAAISGWRPALVFSPWRRDPHPDHIAVSAIVREALGPPCRTRRLEYPVWLPIRGTPADAPAPGEVRTVAFERDDAALERKRFALSAHRSQTTPLVDDDPEGFVMPADLIERFAANPEVFYEEIG